MANLRIHKQSFAGGEVSPDMAGRFDDAKVQSGLALCHNFISKPQGGIENRSGFAFVRAAKYSETKARLIPFTFSADQTMVIEMGAGYFRFHTNGQTLLAGTGEPYEVAHSYSEVQLPDVQHIQSADVLTLVHPEHPPRELRRLGATAWALSDINFQPTIGAPLVPTVVATGVSAIKYDYEYVVTAIGGDGSQSAPSPVGTVGGNLFETGAINTITWAAIPGAVRYRVYKKQGGLFGYIGQTESLSMIDDNISADLGITPPKYDDVFNTSGRIISVPVTNGGSGYGTTAGVVQTVTILDGGTYFNPGAITIIDQAGIGTGATCTYVWSGTPGGPQSLSSVTVTFGGSGYIAPALALSSFSSASRWASTTVQATPNKVLLSVSDTGIGQDAALEAVVVGGAITAVNVTNGGTRYFAPTVAVSQAVGGSGATFGSPVLASQGDYPRATAYFEQRRFFAGTLDKPQQVFATRSGSESDMSYSLPVRDDDRISFKLAARDANHIRHIVPLGSLLLLTSSAEWLVTSVNNDAITPTSISVRPQSYIGASKVQPVVVNNTVIYGAARGGHVREMAYSFQSSGFVSGDLSLRSTHLFDDSDIVDMAYSKAPVPIVWLVSSNGKLLGVTYIPEQQIGAWHQHSTIDGVFESCAVVAEGSEDVLYCMVRRTVNGAQVRYLERMATRQFTDLAHSFFVDSGLTYEGAPVSSLSGLDHLEGCTVSILVDGAVHTQQVVTGGTVNLDITGSVVQVGLPITSQAKTLPMAAALQDGSFAQGHYKNVNKAWVRVLNSSAISIGPSADRLIEYKSRSFEPYGTPPALKNDELPLVLSAAWAASGEIFFQQDKPLPLTLLSITAEVSIGG